MIASFEEEGNAVRHLILYEQANEGERALTLCGKSFDLYDGMPTYGIPKRAETCKECARAFDSVMEFLNRP
jgi:hypothetical protein